jgi:hypothetical protein
MIKLLLTSWLLLLFISLLNRKKQDTLYCGVIGFSGFKGKTFDPVKIAYLLYHNSVERGKDSTGIYTPEVGIIKDSDNAEKFLIANKLAPSSLFIGHVRSATVGVKSKNNAHPFRAGNIIGVHNGTLLNHWSLALKRDIPTADINVDSEVIIKCLNHDQNPKIFSEIDGAAAVLFTDTNEQDNTLYAFRNNDRPLYRGVSDEGMYISSLEETLKIIRCTKIEEFKENNLYTIKLGKIEGIPTKISVKKPVTTVKDYRMNNSTDLYKFVGIYLKYDANHNGIPTMIKGNYYYIAGVEERGNFISFIAEDELGARRTVGKYNFDWTDIDPDVNELGIAAMNIFYANTNNRICKKGDTLQVVKLIPETKKEPKKLFLKAVKSGKTFTADYEFFKRLSTKEEIALKTENVVSDDTED